MSAQAPSPDHTKLAPVFGSVKHSEQILYLLDQHYPDSVCALEYSNALELLIATILSAQCTDKAVNRVTRTLFQKYKSANDFSEANPEELEHELRSIGLYRAKAANIIRCCQRLVTNYDSKIPAAMDDLITLAGVGRKTANVVLGNFFAIEAGVVVDTHVFRVSNRLGLCRATSVVQTEKVLMKKVPRANWTKFSHQIIDHGRKLCDARRPKCLVCPFEALCAFARKQKAPGKTSRGSALKN